MTLPFVIGSREYRLHKHPSRLAETRAGLLTPEELAAVIAEGRDKWRGVIQRAGVKLD
jgi:hypothetical protein